MFTSTPHPILSRARSTGNDELRKLMDEINSVCGDGMSESKEEYKDPINLEGQQLVVWATYESKKPHKFKVCRKFQFAVV
jgi:uncharacterized membrane protein